MEGKRFPLLMGLITRLLITIIICACSRNTVEAGFIGLNWGRQTSHRLIPSMVVDLLLQNDIRHIKIFASSDNVLRALVGGEIDVTTTVPNEGLKTLDDVDNMREWVQEKVTPYLKANVNIGTIHVGNEPFSTISRKITYDNAVDVLEVLNLVLAAEGRHNFTATIPHYPDVLEPGIKMPSEADFRPDIKDKMIRYVTILNRTNSPFVISILPFVLVNENHWDLEFAFMDNKSNFSIRDDNNGLVYTNAFDFVYDSVVTVLTKYGAPDVRVSVGQVGWPTDGYPGANTTNAQRFYKSFLPLIRSNKGTPLRPGISIDVFIHSLADENMLNVYGGNYFHRHWGIYRSSGIAKYMIDFSGRGRDILPTTARGVIMMPRRWCVFNGNTENVSRVKEQFGFACREADCTALAEGGSCSSVDFGKTVSFAFNMYFQAKAQSDIVAACDFDGLGKMVFEDPSVGQCFFPIEILSAEFADRVVRSSGKRYFYGSAGVIILISPLILMFFQLLE